MIRPIQPKEPLSQPEQVKEVVINLKRAGMSRDPSKIKVVLETAAKINQDILDAIPIETSLENKEKLLSLSREVTREISTYEGFSNSLTSHEKEIWKGNWITNLLFMAKQFFTRNDNEKDVSRLITATERELKRPEPDTKLLANNLLALKDCQKKDLSGVLLDLSNLVIKQIESHISFSDAVNSYKYMAKHQLADELLSDKHEVSKNPFETPSFEENQDAIFREQAKAGLILSGKSMDQTAEEIAGDLGAAIIKGNEKDLNELLAKLPTDKTKLGHVISLVSNLPKVEEALNLRPLWNTAKDYDFFYSKGLESKTIASLTQLDSDLRNNKPVTKSVWETLSTLSTKEQDLFFERFSTSNTRLKEETNSILKAIQEGKIPSVEEGETLLLVLPFIERLSKTAPSEVKKTLIHSFQKEYDTPTVDQALGAMDNPLLLHLLEDKDFETYLVDKFADPLAKDTLEMIKNLSKKADILGAIHTDVESSFPQKVRIKTLDKIADKIFTPYLTLKELPKSYEADKAKLEAIKEEFSELPDSEKLTEKLVRHLEQMEAAITPFKTTIKSLSEELKTAKTFAELEAIDKQLAAKTNIQSPQEDIVKLRRSISAQKEALATLGMIAKKTSTPLKLETGYKREQTLQSLNSEYLKLNAEFDSGKLSKRVLFEKYIDLENKWASFFTNQAASLDARNVAQGVIAGLAAELVENGAIPAQLLVRSYIESLLKGPFSSPTLDLAKSVFVNKVEKYLT